MKSNGILVYLRVTPAIIMHRVQQEIDHRPLLKGKSSRELLQYIEEKLESRKSFYEQADIIYDIDNLGQDVVDDLYFALKRF